MTTHTVHISDVKNHLARFPEHSVVTRGPDPERPEGAYFDLMVMMDMIEHEKEGAYRTSDKASGTKYRLGIPATIEQMHLIAGMLQGQFPTIGDAIRAQIKEIQDSEVSMHRAYLAASDEPAAGLATDAIKFVAAHRE